MKSWKNVRKDSEESRNNVVSEDQRKQRASSKRKYEQDDFTAWVPILDPRKAIPCANWGSASVAQEVKARVLLDLDG